MNKFIYNVDKDEYKELDVYAYYFEKMLDYFYNIGYKSIYIDRHGSTNDLYLPATMNDQYLRNIKGSDYHRRRGNICYLNSSLVGYYKSSSYKNPLTNQFYIPLGHMETKPFTDIDKSKYDNVLYNMFFESKFEKDCWYQAIVHPDNNLENIIINKLDRGYFTHIEQKYIQDNADKLNQLNYYSSLEKTKYNVSGYYYSAVTCTEREYELFTGMIEQGSSAKDTINLFIKNKLLTNLQT